MGWSQLQRKTSCTSIQRLPFSHASTSQRGNNGFVSGGEARRLAIWLSWPGAETVITPLGRAGVGKRQTLDRRAGSLALQLAPAHGKLRRSVAPLLVARRHGSFGAHDGPLRRGT